MINLHKVTDALDSLLIHAAVKLCSENGLFLEGISKLFCHGWERADC